MKYTRKIKLYGIALACVLVSTSSCKKYLDINTDPTTATAVDPKLLFGYSVAAWSSYREAGDIYIPLVLAAQSIADGNAYGWDAGDVYDLSPTSMNNVWRLYYNIGGNNLQLAIAQAQKNGSPNTEAQCKVILANLVYEATVLFGDVPFSEAWNPAISYPKFDAQEDVLKGSLAILDDALAKFDETSESKIKDYDVFYNGDIAKWKKLAKSLKLKILFTMVDKDPTRAAAIGALVTDPSLISSAADNFQFKYKTVTNNENPKYRLLARYTNGENQWFFAHKNIMDYMKPVNDPRIPIYFDKPDGASDYVGLDTRELADAKSTLISAYLFRKDAPDLMCSYQEVLFYQAEAYARGLGVTANLATANTLYKKGIEEACKYYGVSATDAAAFASGLPVLTSVTQIHEQQWVDFMDRPIEAFVQYRRSGVSGVSETPALTFPPDVSVGTLLFRRFIYPTAAELNTNVNKPTVIPVYSDKMWFDL